MSLFDSLTGPKWQHSSPQVRKDAIEQLDDQEILLELVASDPDPAVQAAALARISDADTLDRLIEALPQPLRQQARSQRLRQLLPSADGLAGIEDDATLEQIVRLGDDAELTGAAIARIGSDVVRLRIAGAHPIANMRLLAAQAIESIEVLGELMQCAKGHDKTVFRYCKTRVDEHQAKARADAETQQKIRRLCDRAKDLAEAIPAADHETHYRSLLAQWQMVRDLASPEQQQQFEREQARCAQRLAEMADEWAAQERTEALVASSLQEFTALLAEFQRMDEATDVLQDAEATGRLAERLDGMEARWREASKLTAAPAEQSEAWHRSLEQWRCMLKSARRALEQSADIGSLLAEAERVDSLDHQALQQFLERAQKRAKAFPWPESQRERMPAGLAQLHHSRVELAKKLQSLHKEQPAHIARLEKWLGALQTALDRERSAEAERALARVRRSLKTLAPEARRRYEQDLQPLAARLKEVEDWRNFAVEPKKEALCARMTALIGSEEDVEVLAAKIKSLQEEWKQLGALPHARDQALWNEFKAAADEAWKPCGAAFEQQAVLRRKNLSERRKLVAQLDEYERKMEWPEVPGENVQPGHPPPDWKLVQKTLDIARAAFRNMQPVDAKPDRASRKAFRAVCDRIYRHIEHEYTRNIAHKEELLAQARDLADVEDLPQAIESCKQLQRAWKAVGITPVGKDQKLWKAFRAACDAVFNRLEQQRADQSAALKERIGQAESLRDQVSALLKSEDDEALGNLNRALSELKTQLRDIDLPVTVQKRLRRDCELLERQARTRASEQRQNRERARWTGLLQKITACSLRSTDPEAASELWQAAGELPEGIDAEALDLFWQKGPSDGPEEPVREACIALEILAEMESPEEDREVRMKIQMQRLVAGMGRGKEQVEPPLEQRINGMIVLRPSVPWAERYCSALTKIKL